MARKKNRSCELCSSDARMWCSSDDARLCWDCDLTVHSANFLVAKHTRTALCHVCHSTTPWTASGPSLGRTISLCSLCVSRSTSLHPPPATAPTATHHHSDATHHDDDAHAFQACTDDDDNQVVPWTTASSPPPPSCTSCSEEEEEDEDIEEDIEEEEEDSAFSFRSTPGEIGVTTSSSYAAGGFVRPWKQYCTRE